MAMMLAMERSGEQENNILSALWPKRRRQARLSAAGATRTASRAVPWREIFWTSLTPCDCCFRWGRRRTQENPPEREDAKCALDATMLISKARLAGVRGSTTADAFSPPLLLCT